MKAMLTYAYVLLCAPPGGVVTTLRSIPLG
jgi:hypothetical protein